MPRLPPKTSSIVQELRFATVDEYYPDDPHFDAEYLQLTPGPFDSSRIWVEFPGLELEVNRFSAKMLGKEVCTEPGLAFSITLDSEDSPLYMGKELSREHGAIIPFGHEHEVVLPKGFRSVIIYVDQGLVDQLGWRCHLPGYHLLKRDPLRRLTESCRLAMQAARSITADTDMVAAQQGLMPWRDRILSDLEIAFEPWVGVPAPSIEKMFRGTGSFFNVKAAEGFFAQHNPEESFAIDEMCAHLGIRRRTLFHAFRKTLGIGPHTYLQLVRLHKLRALLTKASASDTSVTFLAYAVGFKHMGRLSAVYRELFGEYPSDTLRRR